MHVVFHPLAVLVLSNQFLGEVLSSQIKQLTQTKCGAPLSFDACYELTLFIVFNTIYS